MNEPTPLQEMTPELKSLIRQYFFDCPAASIVTVCNHFNASFADVYAIQDEMNKESKGDPICGGVAYADRREVFSEIDTILGSRAADYGLFVDNARLAQKLKSVITDHAHEAGTVMGEDQWEALEMIATKLSRIVNGNPNKIDNWDDIAGYATLVADRLRGTPR
jgi:hypothetical protein